MAVFSAFLILWIENQMIGQIMINYHQYNTWSFTLFIFYIFDDKKENNITLIKYSR